MVTVRGWRWRWRLSLALLGLMLAACGGAAGPEPDAYATAQASINATNVALRSGSPTTPAAAAVRPTPTADAKSVAYAQGSGQIATRLTAAITDARRIVDDQAQSTIDQLTFVDRIGERARELATIRDDAFRLAPPPNLEDVNGLLVGAAEQATAPPLPADRLGGRADGLAQLTRADRLRAAELSSSATWRPPRPARRPVARHAATRPGADGRRPPASARWPAGGSHRQHPRRRRPAAVDTPNGLPAAAAWSFR
jgi:hypothetical protein